jgi:hypothetical protein
MNRFTLYSAVLFSSLVYASGDGEPKGISEAQWKLEQEFRMKAEQERRKKFEEKLKPNPPPPPWVKFPEHAKEDMFWRMGEGETYLMETMWPYLKYSSKSELENYMRKYPEPKDWSGWYSAYKN